MQPTDRYPKHADHDLPQGTQGHLNAFMFTFYLKTKSNLNSSDPPNVLKPLLQNSLIPQKRILSLSLLPPQTQKYIISHPSQPQGSAFCPWVLSSCYNKITFCTTKKGGGYGYRSDLPKSSSFHIRVEYKSLSRFSYLCFCYM